MAAWTDGVVVRLLEKALNAHGCNSGALDGLLVAYGPQEGARGALDEVGLRVSREGEYVFWAPEAEADDGDRIGLELRSGSPGYVLVVLRLPRPGDETRELAARIAALTPQAREALKALFG